MRSNCGSKITGRRYYVSGALKHFLDHVPHHGFRDEKENAFVHRRLPNCRFFFHP
jgi:hypothetical protein